MYYYSKMVLTAYCLVSKKHVPMETYKVYQTERGGYYIRGESSKCPTVVGKFTTKEEAMKLAKGAKIPIWKGDPATKKKREEAKKRKKARKEKVKEKEKEKKVKEKEKAKKLKEKEKSSKKKK